MKNVKYYKDCVVKREDVTRCGPAGSETVNVVSVVRKHPDFDEVLLNSDPLFHEAVDGTADSKMKIKTHKETCDCGVMTEDWTCVDCKLVRYIGPNCGHVPQPTAVAASKHGGDPVCEKCEDARDLKNPWG